MRIVIAGAAAVLLAVVVGLAVRAGANKDADEATYTVAGDTYSIDCEDRALFLEQWMGPGLLHGDTVFDAWAGECRWAGSGPWLSEAP